MQLRFLCTSYATSRFPFIFRQFSCHPYFHGKMKPGSKTGNSAVRRENAGADTTSPDVFKQPDLANENEFPTLSTSISLLKGKRRARNDLISELEPKSDGVPDHIGSMQLETPKKTVTSSQHSESSPPTSSRNKYLPRVIGLLQFETPKRKNSTSQQDEFSLRKSEHVSMDIHSVQLRSPQTTNSTGMQHESSRHTSYRKKYVPVDIGPEPIQLESPPTTDSASQLDELSLPTSFGKKHVPHFKRRSKFHRDYPPYVGESGHSDSVEDFQVVEPFDICLPRSRKYVLLKSSLPENSTQNRIATENSVEETQQVLRPGMVLLKSYLTMSEQVEIVKTCRELGLGSGGFYQPGYHDGAKLRLQMMCLGKNWDPQTKYEEGRRKDGTEPPGIPGELTLLVKKALEDSNSLIKDHFGASNVEDTIPGMTPDICIVNFYTTSGRLGLHQDRDESAGSLRDGLPVVSFSVGDSAEFLYGDRRDVNKAEIVTLESGDVLIFGGKSRHIFHGVTSIYPNSAPPALLKETLLRPGRLNLTFRQY